MISLLRKSPWLMILLLVSVGPAPSAQTKPGTARAEPAAADEHISAALKQVSAERIRANIEKLVSFGTRLTISAQDSNSVAAGRGIGAAREWIKSEFERYSKDCAGCLEVKTDSFMQPTSERVPSPVQ